MRVSTQTSEKKILLPGFKLTTFQSRVQRSTNTLSWLPVHNWLHIVMCGVHWTSDTPLLHVLCWTGYQGDHCELGSLSSSEDIASGKSKQMAANCMICDVMCNEPPSDLPNKRMGISHTELLVLPFFYTKNKTNKKNTSLMF